MTDQNSSQNNSRLNRISANTLIPIGFAVTIMGFVWFAATLTASVNANKTKINEAVADMDQLPTRTEFDTMKDDLSIIKADIKTLLKEAK